MAWPVGPGKGRQGGLQVGAKRRTLGRPPVLEVVVQDCLSVREEGVSTLRLEIGLLARHLLTRKLSSAHS